MSVDREQWLEWRRQGIGGSDVSAILGLSRWGSPWTVYCNKTGITGDQEPTEAMWWGTALEDDIKARFELDTGLTVVNAQAMRVHPDHDWMRCTLDGEVVDSTFGATEPDAVWEAKYTRDSIEDWALQGGVPMEYACQTTWNMLVTGHTKCFMAVAHCAFGLELKVYELHLDESDANEVLDAASQFWWKHVVPRRPPPADSSEASTRVMGRMWGDPDGEIEADPELERMVAEAIAAKARRTAAEEEATLALNSLRARLADKTEIVRTDPDTGKRRTIASWRPDKNGQRTLRTPGVK